MSRGLPGLLAQQVSLALTLPCPTSPTPAFYAKYKYFNCPLPNAVHRRIYLRRAGCQSNPGAEPGPHPPARHPRQVISLVHLQTTSTNQAVRGSDGSDNTTTSHHHHHLSSSSSSYRHHRHHHRRSVARTSRIVSSLIVVVVVAISSSSSSSPYHHHHQQLVVINHRHHPSCTCLSYLSFI